MSQAVDLLSIPLSLWDDGSMRVGGTRLTLDTIYEYFDAGYSPEEIAATFPVITLADVYAVIAYCLRNADSVRDYISRRDAHAAEARRRVESLARLRN
jgi:uncharacterized protein (DUF433 family)